MNKLTINTFSNLGKKSIYKKYFEILDMYIKLGHSIDLTYTVPENLIINVETGIFHDTISINIEVINSIGHNLLNPNFISIFEPLIEKYNVRIRKRRII